MIKKTFNLFQNTLILKTQAFVTLFRMYITNIAISLFYKTYSAENWASSTKYIGGMFCVSIKDVVFEKLSILSCLKSTSLRDLGLDKILENKLTFVTKNWHKTNHKFRSIIIIYIELKTFLNLEQESFDFS